MTLSQNSKSSLTTYQTGEVCDAEDLVIAGWAGRDADAIEKHILELVELGVPRPQKTPTFYQVSAGLITFKESLQFVGDATSGEVEIVVIHSNEKHYVTVGSDHTDRKLETVGVALSKQICDKPIANEAWDYDDVKGHWDELILRSWVREKGVDVLYQEGFAALNRSFSNLQELFANELAESGKDNRFKNGVAMFCGTLPVKGEFRSGSAFTMELVDPVLNRTIRHTYNICMLPEVG